MNIRCSTWNISIIMLPIYFVAGYISACGSFIEYTRGNHQYFAFQIKTPSDNSILLNQIASFFSLNNRVYNYKHGTQSYALLIVRDRNTLERTLIPFFNEYLVGIKKHQFLDWQGRFLNNSSTWNFRNIKSISNPQMYKIVDKKPNTDKN